MEITIHLTAEEERGLRERAERCGCSLNEYLTALILRDPPLPGPLDEVAPARRPIEEATPDPLVAEAEGRIQPSTPLAVILGPIHRDFAESGMTEAELDALIEEAREEVRREKHGPAR